MNPPEQDIDELPEYPGDMGRFLRELRENPDALALMRALCVIPDVRDLSYNPRRANLDPDSIVQQFLYEVVDNVAIRDAFVEALLKDHFPPAEPED